MPELPQPPSPPHADTQRTLRCPTCGASQPASAECRRCKCDLGLLLAMLDRERNLHQNCLCLLQAGRFTEAITVARQWWQLAPGPAARRLLAIAYLGAGHYRAALQVAESPLPTPS